ncbi:MAG: glycosyl hydrolase family 65 protein [Elusimicrobiota bacterium]
MSKEPIKYLKTDPWRIIEEGFHPERSRVSESVFSLANEYMGVRGYFEEGYSGEKLIGSYFNGVFETRSITHDTNFIGFARRMCFMVNSVDWLYTRISAEGEQLDLSRSKISEFVRTLDMKTGTLSRGFIWHLPGGKELKVTFERFLSMHDKNLGIQRIMLKPINFSGTVELSMGLDFSVLHDEVKTNYWECPKKEFRDGSAAIIGRTKSTGLHVFSSFRVESGARMTAKQREEDRFIGYDYKVGVQEGKEQVIDKIVVNHVERSAGVSTDDVWSAGISLEKKHEGTMFDTALAGHAEYWGKVWDTLDITVEGNDEDQQGIRFCIFGLHQAYHGEDATLNVGAKGLTGERYWGWAWWDTETYCLPFYLFNNPKAARALVEYRHNYLPQALTRAKELDCEGACYPMGTIDGTESCGTWQHGNLEVHVSAAVPYGIWHYMKIYGDKEFLYGKGIEILLQSCRYFASRGAWSPGGEYGIYGVMGPDEFHMMVNNNCYTNVMAKKVFEYTFDVISEMDGAAPDKLTRVYGKVGLRDGEMESWRMMADKMRVPFDKKTGVYEQHDGYFELPHIDIDSIPAGEWPLYTHWAYDRIFRYDMIKQPDVLLFLFFFSRQYPLAVKKKNYDYYEPRCSHESSLSPAIHSIMAAEIGKLDEAEEFFSYATRIDLDDYNRDTYQGLHVTSMASSWMNIVYGFGGLRSDGDKLVFNPVIIKKWKAYSFRILYRGDVISVSVDGSNAVFKIIGEGKIPVSIYGKDYQLTQTPQGIPLK